MGYRFMSVILKTFPIYSANAHGFIKKYNWACQTLLAFVLVFNQSLATAQGTAEGEPVDPVFLFNSVCYSVVPDVKRLQDMALRFAWGSIKGEDLAKFSEIESPKLLQGWDIRLGERIFRLGLVQSIPAESFIETFPEFKDADSTSCSIILDGQDNADVILDRMNTLVGKAPVTESVPEGELLTTTWAGGNDAVKVFVFFKSDLTNSANLLNVTLFAK